MLLFFLHGFLGGPEDWQPVIEHLPPHFVCTTLDLNAKDPLQQARKRVEKETSPFFLIGYSMGGRIAWQLASQFSSLSGLVVLGAHPGLKSEEERQARKKVDEEWATLLEKGDMDEFLTRWYANPSASCSHASFPAKVRRSQRDPPTSARCSARAGLSTTKATSCCPHTLFAWRKGSEMRSSIAISPMFMPSLKRAMPPT